MTAIELNDPTLMTEDEFFAKIERAEKQQGKRNLSIIIQLRYRRFLSANNDSGVYDSGCFATRSANTIRSCIHFCDVFRPYSKKALNTYLSKRRSAFNVHFTLAMDTYYKDSHGTVLLSPNRSNLLFLPFQ